MGFSLGSIAEKLCDAVLPDRFEAVGDLVGAAVDLQTGNIPGVLDHAIDFLKDLGGNSQDSGVIRGRPPCGPTDIDPPPGRSADPDDVLPLGYGGNGTAVLMRPQASADLFSLSDKDFMKAIREGRIPKDVVDDKAAMLRLQERMQSIREMNDLLTQLMQAMHQMSMSIIANMRA